jgi:hypothetical protein
MATLTTGISASTVEFSVTGDVSAAETGESYRIDDEVIILREFVRTKAVRRGPRNPNRWSVSRGQAGTTAASHLTGAEIVAVEEAVTTSETLVPPDPFAGEGGAAVEQTMSILGPFAIDWTQEASLTGDGVALVELPLDCTVIRAWAHVTVRWDGAGSPGSTDYVMYVGVGTTLSGMVTATSYNQWRVHEPSSLPGVVIENPGQSSSSMNFSVVRVTDEGLSLMAQLQNFAGALNAGSADIYALIGTTA